jgi:hypothetical protein
MRAYRLLPLLLVVFACKEEDPGDVADGTGSPDQVGQQCAVPGDCYPEIDPAEIAGQIECLDRVRGGYCTHQCGDDADCCAVEGECLTDLPQVCSPFESTGLMMCFLSCEDEHVDGAGAADENVFCQEWASWDFICRSSGGGSDNRKVCVPGDCGVGAWCDGVDDCDADLDCVDGIDGGWCGRADCASSADCPQESVCIGRGDGTTLCVPTCQNDGDCSFCRPEEFAGACRDDVEYIDGSGPAVCVPP